VVETVRGKALADTYKLRFLETSAKDSINIEEAFITLVKDIKKRAFDNPVTTDGGGGGGGGVVRDSETHAHSRGCCS
jgi:Ras family